MPPSRTVQRVTAAIQKLYPPHLADKSWDNTGLLVDASDAADSSPACRIVLAIDLTQAVAAEAVAARANVVIAYHPFIFRGLKAITSADPQQRSLLSLVKHSVSVYSPHTAVDSARGGVNDFLADGLAAAFAETARSVIQPDAAAPGCGMGRLLTLSRAPTLPQVVAAIKAHLGLSHVQVAPAANGPAVIRTVAICAGSGGSVFRGVEADLYLTGELSHHEALFFAESGAAVVACGHSNTERGFLPVLKRQLQEELPDAEILISAEDKDPFSTW